MSATAHGEDQPIRAENPWADPGLALPDLADPDLAHPDLAHPDLAHPDLAHPDLAGPARPGLAGHDPSRGGPRLAGRHRTETRARPSFGALFTIREFRALWAAQTLSYAGDQIAQVAIAILVYTRTGSPSLTALAYALTYLPPLVGGPLLSGLADLIPRRQLMIALDLGRAGLVTIMAMPYVPLALMCTLLFATVLLGPPFAAARAAMLPDVVPSRTLVLGFTAGNMTFQAGQAGGFLVGGTLVALLGAHRALALDALSFCLSAAVIAGWVRNRPNPEAPSAPRRSPAAAAWSSAREGTAIVFRHAGLRTLVLLGWLAGFAVVPEGLAAPYARRLGGGSLTVGLLMAAMPAGMVAGGMVVSRVTSQEQRIRMIGWLAVLSCMPLICSLLRPPLWLVVPLWVLAGAAGAYQLTAAAAFVQALPNALRARAFSVAQTGLLAAQGLGILVAGAAASRLGPQAAVGIAGVLGVGAAAILATVWASAASTVIRPWPRGRGRWR
jgi:MFS family permease